jgi:hypothetical protein
MAADVLATKFVSPA